MRAAILEPGRILAVNGENGIQAQVLAPGWHFWKWAWQYKIEKVSVIEIKEGYVGLVQASDGQSLPEDTIYAPQWQNPDKMFDAAMFAAFKPRSVLINTARGELIETKALINALKSAAV